MCNISTVGLDGKLRDMTMLHLDTLPMWLATLSSNQVAEEIKATLVLFQKEAVKVLRDHFYGGRRKELPPMSPLDQLEMQVQAMRQHELRLDDMDRRVLEIEAARSCKVPDKTQRILLNEILQRSAAGSHAYPEVIQNNWRLLYREFLKRYSIDIRKRARHSSMKPLEWAEQKGQLGNLIELAKALYG